MSNQIEMITIDDINILNPRVRNQRVFQTITENIIKVGLKRPITVTKSKTGEKSYDLVCGQGRIEAFQSHDQTHIPAIIIEASENDALIMSLVENLARRQHRSLDLLQGIEALQQKGYSAAEIAIKTGLSDSYIYAVLDLLKRGEQRLLIAVEAGHIPLTVAMSIATSSGSGQAALQDAYEKKLLRGKKLLLAKNLIEKRQRLGKGMGSSSEKRNNQSGAGSGKVTSQDVMDVYQREVDRKTLLTRKATLVSHRLLFITQSLRRIYAEEHFATLLKAEGIETLPKPIAELLGENV
ncbi:MAG: plasmid partitioning protein RepB C-terminal domain-containing protein [Rickettsiales bacterium]|nr:plasmid partitioning protein RepB C-terminal domain-containing protein [Rickettsiales bacterium]